MLNLWRPTNLLPNRSRSENFGLALSATGSCPMPDLSEKRTSPEINVCEEALKLPRPKFRVLSGQTLHQGTRQRRSFRDQTGNPVSQARGARSREPRQLTIQNGIAEQSRDALRGAKCLGRARGETGILRGRMPRRRARCRSSADKYHSPCLPRRL